MTDRLVSDGQVMGVPAFWRGLRKTEFYRVGQINTNYMFAMVAVFSLAQVAGMGQATPTRYAGTKFSLLVY